MEEEHSPLRRIVNADPAQVPHEQAGGNGDAVIAA
jgi:hypothetical protein